MEPKRPSVLRKYRTTQGLTTRKLGYDLGIVPNYLTKIEYGTISCGELMARRLGEYFAVNWKEFLSEKY